MGCALCMIKKASPYRAGVRFSSLSHCVAVRMFLIVGGQTEDVQIIYLLKSFEIIYKSKWALGSPVAELD